MRIESVENQKKDLQIQNEKVEGQNRSSEIKIHILEGDLAERTRHIEMLDHLAGSKYYS